MATCLPVRAYSGNQRNTGLPLRALNPAPNLARGACNVGSSNRTTATHKENIHQMHLLRHLPHGPAGLEPLKQMGRRAVTSERAYSSFRSRKDGTGGLTHAQSSRGPPSGSSAHTRVHPRDASCMLATSATLRGGVLRPSTILNRSRVPSSYATTGPDHSPAFVRKLRQERHHAEAVAATFGSPARLSQPPLQSADSSRVMRNGGSLLLPRISGSAPLEKSASQRVVTASLTLLAGEGPTPASPEPARVPLRVMECTPRSYSSASSVGDANDYLADKCESSTVDEGVAVNPKHMLVQGRVASVRGITDSATEVTLVVPPSFSFSAGQCTELHHPQSELVSCMLQSGESRLVGELPCEADAEVIPDADVTPPHKPVVLSMASAPQEHASSGTIRFVVKRSVHEGSMSQFLSQVVRPGADLLLRTPGYSQFSYTERKHRPVVLLAAGIGITPIYSIVCSAYATFVHAASGDGPLPDAMTLVYSAQRADDFLYCKELREFSARSGGRLRVHFTITRPEDALDADRGGLTDGDTGHGRISGYLLDRLEVCSESMFYICGPPPMVRDAVGLLESRGVDPGNTCYNRWGW